MSVNQPPALGDIGQDPRPVGGAPVGAETFSLSTEDEGWLVQNDPEIPSNPGDRLRWLVSQNARWHQALDLQLGARGEQTNAPLTEEQATKKALRRVMLELQDPERGPKLKSWFRGEQQAKQLALMRQKLAETGDVHHAQRVAEEQAGYKLPIATINETPELLALEKIKQQAQDPGGFKAWLGEPVKRFVSGAAQSVADFAIGTANLVGADVEPVDVYARMNATMRAMTGEGFEHYESLERQEQLRRMLSDEQRSGLLSVVQGGSELAGSLYGMMRGPGRIAFGGGNMASKAVLKNAPKWVQSTLGNVLGFGAYDFVTAGGGAADMDERGKEALIGGAMGVVATVANALGRGAMRAIIGTEKMGQRLAGEEANTIFNKWLGKAKLSQAGSETREQYIRRAINQFVGEGAPGLPIDASKLFAIGARAATEAGAFTAADMAFGRSLYEQMLGQKVEADNWEQFFSTALGLAFLHSNGRFDLLRNRQRQQVDPTRSLVPVAQPPAEPGPSLKATPRQPAGEPVDAEFRVVGSERQIPEQAVGEQQRAGDAVRAEFERGEADYRRAQAEERFARPQEPVKQDIEGTLAAEVTREQQARQAAETPIEMPYERPDLLRLGWEQEPQPTRQKEPNYFRNQQRREARAEALGAIGDKTKATTVRINGASLEWLRLAMPKRMSARKQIEDQIKVAGKSPVAYADVTFTAGEAQELADNFVRLGPKWRQKYQDEARINQVDAAIEKIAQGFGVDTAPPRGTPFFTEGDLRRTDDQPLGPVAAVQGQPEPQPEFDVNRWPDKGRDPEAPPEGGVPAEPVPPEDRGPAGATKAPAEGLEGAIQILDRRVVRFQDSPFAYVLEGDEARPNRKLREATGLPAKMPADEFLDKVTKLSLFNQLQAKAILPGEEITATGWKADVRDPAEDGAKMRTIHFGQVVERPLAPEGEWVPAEPFKPRTPDEVPEIQRAVANDLETLSQRPELAAEDQALLGSVVGVLNTVSGEKDPAVAETVQALQTGAFAETFAQDPAAGIKATAEMLTTKAPEVVVQEMATEAAQSMRNPAEMTAGEINKELDRLARQSSKQTEAMIAAGRGSETFTESRTKAAAGDSAAQRRLAIADRESALQREVEARYGPNPPSRLPRGFKRRKPPADRQGEAGAFDVVGAVEQLLGFVADNPFTRAIGAKYIERVRRQIGEPMAAKLREVQSNFDQIRSSLQPHMHKMAETRGELTGHLLEKRYEEVRPGLRIATTRWFDAHESEWAARTGRDRSQLTAEDREILEPLDGILEQTREIAHDDGVQVNGKVIDRDRSAYRLPRHLTAAGARRARELDPQLVEALAYLKKTTTAQVRRWLEDDHYTDARSLHRADAIETQRHIELWPEFLEVDGRLERQLETRPIRVGEQIINGFSLRMGLMRVFGPDTGKTAEPYGDVIAREAHGDSNRRLLAEVFRVAGGMQPDDEVGAFERSLRQILRPFTTLYTSGKLTSVKSDVQNIVEPFSSAAAVLGWPTIVRAYGKVTTAIGRREFYKLQEEMVEEGGFLRMIHDRNIEFGGTARGVVAGAQDAANVVGRDLMTFFDLGQEFADTVIRQAIGDRVELMQQGDGGQTGMDFAMSMGFSAARARAIAEGKGTPQDYEFLLSMGLPSFSGRGDHPLNRTPLKKTSEKLMTRFLNYVIKQVGRLQQYGAAIREAQTPQDRDAASLALLKYLGGHAIGGAFVNGLATLLTQGLSTLIGRPEDYVSEYMEDWTTPGGVAKQLGFGMLTGILGAIGVTLNQGFNVMFQPNPDDRLEAIKRIVTGLSAPLGGAAEFGEFMTGLVSDTADTRYRGYSTLGKIWVAAQTFAPIARDVNRGLGGFAAIALTDDPDLRAANTAMLKWKDKNDIEEPQYGEINEFNTLMRSFELELREPGAINGLSVGDIAGRILRALPKNADGEPDRERAVSSLHSRRKLNWLRKYAEDYPTRAAEFERAMGPKRMATLRGYDYLLDRVADAVYPEEEMPREKRMARRRARKEK